MANYQWAHPRELQGRLFEFRARIRDLERGVNDDGEGGSYPDPEAQAQWFRDECKKIEAELERRRWLG